MRMPWRAGEGLRGEIKDFGVAFDRASALAWRWLGSGAGFERAF